MSVNIVIAGVSYSVPSSAADTNWAADQVAFEQALAAAVAASPRVLYSNVGPVGTGANTTEDTLMSYTLPGGTLSANHMGIRITASGAGVSTSDTTTLRCYFGSAVATLVLTASQANTWRAVFEVYRASATVQAGMGTIAVGGTAQSTYNSTLSATETLANDIVVKFTGQRATSSVANSVQQFTMLVELLPLPIS